MSEGNLPNHFFNVPIHFFSFFKNPSLYLVKDLILTVMEQKGTIKTTTMHNQVVVFFTQLSCLT
jgi:hypothetical protein